MAMRGESKIAVKPVAARAAARAKRLEELRQRARLEGTTAELFPTATPVGEEPRGVEGEIISPSNRLDVLAAEIRTHVHLADRLEGMAFDNRLHAAVKLAEARALCAERHIPFRAWCEKMLPTITWVVARNLAALGSAPDPAEALANLREYTAQRNREYRDRHKARALLAQRMLEQQQEQADTAGPFAPVGGVEGLANMKLSTASAHGRRRTATALPEAIVQEVAKTLRAEVPPREEAEVTVEKLLALFDKLDDDDKREFLLLASDRLGLIIKEAEQLDV